MASVSLVIPFYNEEECLRQNVDEVLMFLSSRNLEFEILLGDDGSIDESSKIAISLAKEHPEHIRVIKNDQNQGKGSILTKCFMQAKMDLLCFIDADLEIPLKYLDEVLRHLEDPSVDVVVGSKLKSRQPLVRATHRHGASIVYNSLVHWLLGSKVSDHQCGLKGFGKNVLQRVLYEVQEVSWTWDTEVLLLLQREGASIREISVELSPVRSSRVAFIKTVAFFLRRLWKLRRRSLSSRETHLR